MATTLKHWIRFLPDGGGELSAEASAMEARIAIEAALREQRRHLARQLAEVEARILAFGRDTDGENIRLTSEASKAFSTKLVDCAKDCAYRQGKRVPAEGSSPVETMEIER